MQRLVLATLVICVIAIGGDAAVYIGGGCYDCNPPGGQAPGVYTANGGGSAYPNSGAGRGAAGGGSYYNPGPAGGGGRPVYSGNFGPDGYNGGGSRYSGGGGYPSQGYSGGGGGGGGDAGVNQYIGL